MKLILYIVVFYLAYTMLIKPFLKIFLRQYFEKEFQKFQGQQRSYNAEPKRPEGTIKVDYVPENNGKSKKNTEIEGEYIDYEEVK